ncbi:MAG: lysostaphin resistance A-like protein [Armatimonadota bacterium]
MAPDSSDVVRRRAVRSGLGAAVRWTLIDFSVRDLILFAIAGLALHSGNRLQPGELIILSYGLFWPAMLILGLVFLRRIQREGLPWAALGYGPWRWAILPGLIGAIIVLGLSFVEHPITHKLFGTESADQSMEMRRAAGLPAGIFLLLPANGVLAPVVEELAWRGYIQTRLIRGWGSRTGIAATVLLFALNHVVVDASFHRIVILLTGGLVLGVVGHRWGTSASTVTHVLMNSAATLIALFEL